MQELHVKSLLPVRLDKYLMVKWHQAVKCVKNAGMKKANMAERAGREYIDRLQRIYEDSGRTDSK